MKYQFIKEIELIIEAEGGVIFNELDERFYGLDFVGCLICEKIKENEDLDNIINFIADKYKIDRPIITNDINEFIKSLVDNGLLIENHEN